MKRFDYFILSMRAELFRRPDWVVTAFAQVREDADAWKKDAYPYRLVQTPTGCMYVDPNNIGQLLPIEDCPVGEAPFKAADRIILPKNAIANVKEEIETCYGNFLYNATVLANAFGDKVPFMTGRLHPGKIEEAIQGRLEDVPEDENAPRDPTKLYVDELLVFNDATFYLANFAPLFVPAGTAKSLLPPPGIEEFRAKLFEQYKDRLGDGTAADPQAVALIMKELLAYDKEFLKGDKALDSMLSAKSFEVVRARKFLMYGAEVGLSDSPKVELISNSLVDGLNPDKFPIVNNTARAGSFNRGAQTMLGGELVKWLLRASSNINVLPDDCGTKLGHRVTLLPEMRKKYLNFHVQTESGAVKMTDDVIDQYLGKYIAIRSPQYCKAALTDICAICAGPRLAENPTAASAGISNYGSVLMLIYMKAMHGKALTVADFDYETALT